MGHIMPREFAPEDPMPCRAKSIETFDSVEVVGGHIQVKYKVTIAGHDTAALGVVHLPPNVTVRIDGDDINITDIQLDSNAKIILRGLQQVQTGKDMWVRCSQVPPTTR